MDVFDLCLEHGWVCVEARRCALRFAQRWCSPYIRCRCQVHRAANYCKSVLRGTDELAEFLFPTNRQLRARGIINHHPRRAPCVQDRDDTAGGGAEQIRKVTLPEATSQSQALLCAA